jgi:hypothetical protein
VLSIVRRARWARLSLALIATFAFAVPANAAETSVLYEVYDLTGYQVAYAPDRGTFMGVGSGSAGELSAWFTQVDHSLVITPSGTVTGGHATFTRSDGVSMSGRFTGGIVWMTNDGPNCTNESHEVRGMLSDVTRSDRPDAKGIAYFSATLQHYRAWIFGSCYSYFAKVTGTFSILLEIPR